MDLPSKILGISTPFLLIAVTALWYIKIYRPKHARA